MARNKKLGKYVKGLACVAGITFAGMYLVAKKKKPDYTYKNEPEERNPLAGQKVVFVQDDNDAENADGVRGHLEAVGASSNKESFYGKYGKRAFDIVLSFGGLVVLAPLYAAIALAIKIEDPGPVLFTQKRMGQNKEYFKLHKFRSMKVSTPHDVPTHQLENPDQYITKVGKFIRAHSLDELPQIWDIFVGNMSVIGPRPGLWNQDLLTAERDKYGANDVKPGLTGWAQINGRDELEIPVKAKLDGEYVQKQSLLFDLKCFLGTVSKVSHDDSVVEGGTGEMKKNSYHYTEGKSDAELIGNIGFGEAVEVDQSAKKRILITGARSYIGQSFIEYTKNHYRDNFEIDELDMMNDSWRDYEFSRYDIVYHVAGIAHADVGNVSEETKKKYYDVNTGLTIEVAEKAKREGVKTFIFMSSMIVYGESAPYGTKKVIDEVTVPNPANFYGDSKLQADVAVRELADETYKVIVLRPPMIYGKNSKGNYRTLSKLAKKLPVFPDVDNERSMLYIGNLCEFLCQIMLLKTYQRNAVVLLPQNREWVKTADMVKEIAKASGKKIIESKVFTPAVVIGSKMPGKIGVMVNKAFGNNCYAHDMSVYEKLDYQKSFSQESVVRFEESVRLGKKLDAMKSGKKSKSMLMLASVASMIDQFNMNNIVILLSLGYRVDVACNFESGNTCSDERINELKVKLNGLGVHFYQINFDRNVMQLSQNMTAYEQVKKLVKQKEYDFIHCHSPIGGVIGRIVAHETKTKVIYTAHGFHFYDGAPKKNWMMYYPVEKFLSKWTDVLITINKEDYGIANKNLCARKTYYVPGIGIDIKRFKNNSKYRNIKRAQLGLDESDFVIISVGELNDNKNHKVIIEALSKMNDGGKCVYVIAGEGANKNMLKGLAEYGKVELKLLGFRTDIPELLEMSDVFVLPSLREGLNVSLMEAMAAGLPCIAGKIRGNVDLLSDEYCIDPTSVEMWIACLKKVMHSNRSIAGIQNAEKIENFSVDKVNETMVNIYKNM